MDDEKRLSEDELAAIEERDKYPLVIIGITTENIHMFNDLLKEIDRTWLDRRALLLHTRALENELHIERAQKYYDAYWKAKWTGTLEEFLAENPEPPQGDWTGD